MQIINSAGISLRTNFKDVFLLSSDLKALIIYISVLCLESYTGYLKYLEQWFLNDVLVTQLTLRVFNFWNWMIQVFPQVAVVTLGRDIYASVSQFSRSVVSRLFVTPWTAAHQASLSITNMELTQILVFF